MYSVYCKPAVSLKTGFAYLAIKAYNNRVEVSSICIRAMEDFAPYGKHSTQGMRNLWSRFLESLSERFVAEGADVSVHAKPLSRIDRWIMTEADEGKVGGVAVPDDGWYLIQDGKVYSLSNAFR